MIEIGLGRFSPLPVGVLTCPGSPVRLVQFTLIYARVVDRHALRKNTVIDWATSAAPDAANRDIEDKMEWLIERP